MRCGGGDAQVLLCTGAISDPVRSHYSFEVRFETLSLSPVTHRMTGGSVSNELEISGSGRELVDLLSCTCLQRLSRHMRDLSQDIRCPDMFRT